MGDPTKPMVGGNTDLAASGNSGAPDANYLTDRRNLDPTLQADNWITKLRLAWLVSGSNPDPGASASENKVKLVGSGTLGPNPANPATDPVTVPMVDVFTNGNPIAKGGYAYWVGDESQKARIDQKPSDKQPSTSAPTDGGMARLAGAEGPNFRFVKSGTTSNAYVPIQDLSAADRAKLMTPASIALKVNPSNKDAYKKNFHDLTSYSMSILADAREGGLQKDMTAYINSTSIDGIKKITGIPGTGLNHVSSSYSSNLATSGLPILPGAFYETWGPNYVQLRKWYELRKKITGTLGNGRTSPVLLPSRTAGPVFANHNYGPMPDIKSHEQPIQPYMTDCKMLYDYSVDTARGTNNLALRLHIYPRVTLWNPYNVTLAGTKYLVGFLKVVGGMSAASGGSVGIPNTNSSYYGDATDGNMIYFTLNAPDMAPGECLVFSPETLTESAKYSIADVTANILSPSVPSGGLSNFYFDSNRQLPDPADPPVEWMNQPYSIHLGETRQFVLKKAGAGSPVTHADAQTGASHPIIQRMAVNSCGEDGSYYAGSNHGNWKGSESMRLLRSTAGHDGAVPSRHWTTEARLQWLDECSGENGGPYRGRTGSFPIRKPIIANFNIRPSMVHRSNFCTAYEQWYWNYGSYLESRAEQMVLNAPAFQGAYSGKSYGSPFGYPADYSTVKSFVMFDLPQNNTPVFSLACFQHAQLGYQGWQPTYVIGNSMCEPRSGSGENISSPTIPSISRDCTINTAYLNGYRSGGYGGSVSTYRNAWDKELEIDRNINAGKWDDLIQNTESPSTMSELLFYDSSFMVNHALWDRFFLSSVPYSTTGTINWSDATPLPNTRMVLNPYYPGAPADRTNRMIGANPFDYAAYFLMNQGALNINSTSVEAWRAFFSSMNDVSRPTIKGQTIAGAFSRLLIPNTNDSVSGQNHFAAAPWNGARTLTEPEINALAQRMVEVVKSRGPFLGLADFVNRRLVTIKGIGTIGTATSADASLCGPLQAAIEASGINSALQNPSITSAFLGSQGIGGGDACTSDADRGGWSFDNRSLDPDYWAFAPWKTFGMPGYVTQADILQTIGQSITSRGDTFLIRGYGEARDAKGNVTAKAWCEAVVQRTPDYYVPKSVTSLSGTDGNNPLEPAVIRSTADYSLAPNPALVNLNKQLGRRFVITQFRWLSPSDV